MSLDTIRYRFKQLRRSSQLVDGVDFIRDDYVNETNFVYRVNPARFYLEAGFPSLAGSRPLASSPPSVASESTRTLDIGASDPASEVASEKVNAATDSLAVIEILRERLSFRDEQIGWKQEQLDEVREEISTLREERKMFTRALTHAFETIQGLNAQLMAIAAPSTRSATAGAASSTASSPASEGAENYASVASNLEDSPSVSASEDGGSFQQLS
jgi:hypothetical protein